ncbi:MAG: toxin-antitoxin system HicB family antitoxin [Pseudomonadota bacterium]|nr:toxin-antitoxin system HicB family antitoxin [Pseudomonadota bacterium]
MSIDPHAYNITIRRDRFEGEVLFEARVKELPDVAEYGETYEDAYSLALDTIETAAEAFAERGRAFPAALVPAEDYSGRVTLRLPRSLHRALAEASESEGVSLNQHLVNVLSYYSGFAAGQHIDSGAPWRAVPRQHEKPTRKPHLRVVDSQDLQAVG